MTSLYYDQEDILGLINKKTLELKHQQLTSFQNFGLCVLWEFSYPSFNHVEFGCSHSWVPDPIFGIPFPVTFPFLLILSLAFSQNIN